MAKPSPIAGKFPGSIGTEKLPRKIPAVSARLDTKIRTKEHQNFIIRDLLGLELVGKNWTYDWVEYEAGINSYVPTNSNQHKAVGPKLLVSAYSGAPDFVSLGEYVILRPIVRRQGTYIVDSLAKLSTSNQAVDSAIRKYPQVKESSLSPSFRWRPYGYARYQLCTVIGPENGNDAFIMKELPSQPANVFTISEKIYSEIESDFKLIKNQPFSFGWMINNHTFDATFMDFVKNKSNWEDSNKKPKLPYTQFYSESEREQPAIEITWGSFSSNTQRFKLIIRRSGNNISLWRERNGKWELVQGVRSLKISSDQPFQDFVVYPVARQLWIVPSKEIDNSSIKNGVVFDLDEDIQIAGTYVRVALYGAKQGFKWNNLSHARQAVMLSPALNCGIPTIENAFVNLTYVDKNSVCRDQVNAKTDIDNSLIFNKKRNLPFGQAEQSPQKADSTKIGADVDFIVEYQLVANKTDVSQIYSRAGLSETDERYTLSQRTIKLFSSDQSNEGKDSSNYLKWIIVAYPNPAKPNSELVKSPILQRIELTAIAPMSELNLNPIPQINSADIMNASISEGVSQITASVVLNNRERPELQFINRGIYTHEYSRKSGADLGNFVGIKPITIRGGVIGGSHFVSQNLVNYTGFGESKQTGYESLPIRFRGYIVDRQYSRPNSSTSTVTLNCEDVSRRAKDHLTFNLPIFDGYCNLAAMYYLLRDAGYQDDEILLRQDMNNPNSKGTVKLYDLLVEAGNDPHNFSGPCFSGHTKETGGIPKRSKLLEGLGAISMATLHALLPLNVYKQQPNYMFAAGQNTWDCCSSIREFTGFYLYANALGNIVYCPPELQFKLNAKSADPSKKYAVRGQPNGGDSDDLVYYETSQFDAGVPNGKAYNQFQNQLVNSIATEEMRNAVALFGLIPDSENNIMWSPHVVVKRPKTLVEDIAQPWFAPWLRWAIVKNPNWNDGIRNEKLAEELFNRLRRTQAKVNFGLWGQPGHYIFQRFKIDEHQMNETGAHGLEFVTIQVNHMFDASSMKFSTEIQGEHLDFSQFDFAPHVTGTPLRVYTGSGGVPGKQAGPTTGYK